VAAYHHPMLSCETIHFHVKDPMALDWGLHISFFCVKCHPDILHLFGNSVSPESIPAHLVEGMSFIDVARDTCLKLLAFLDETSLLHCCDDVTSFLQSKFTHHAKACFLLSPPVTEHSATSIGLDSLTSGRSSLSGVKLSSCLSTSCRSALARSTSQIFRLGRGSHALFLLWFHLDP
jgi:hypothetical protein